MSLQVTEKVTLLPARICRDSDDRRSVRMVPNAPPPNKETETYAYDGLSQVTQRQRGAAEFENGLFTGIASPPKRREDFTYDTLGNWQRYDAQQNPSAGEVGLLFNQSRTHNPANQITGFSNTTQPVTHDAAGNTTQSAPVQGSEDTINWDASHLYQWDAWNRLVRITHSGTGAEIARHAYDGLTRRTTLQEGGSPVRHFYYNDQWRSVEETLDSGSITTPERRHLYNPLNRWHLIHRFRNTPTLENLYCLHDAMDPIAITNATGVVLERFNYSTFGMRRVMEEDFDDKSMAHTDYAWNWEFHGEFSDAASGLHNYGWRYYSPITGAWHGRDPIGEVLASNLYLFCLNNPPAIIDNVGLSVAPLPASSINYKPTPPSTFTKAPPDCVCGADISDWFAAEVDSQKSAWDGYNRDYNTRNGSFPGYYQYTWWSYNNHYYKSLPKGIAGAVMPSPTMTPPSFNAGVVDSKGRNCGDNKFCGNTITLCGKCIHKSVLGNLMFGMMLKHSGINKDSAVGYAEALKKKYSNPDPYDPPVFQAGYDAYDATDRTVADFSKGGAFCVRLDKAEKALGFSTQWLNEGGGTAKDLSTCILCDAKTKLATHYGTSPTTTHD